MTPFSWVTYRRALGFALPHWKRFVFAFVVGLAATGIGLFQPYISKLLIDEALLKRDFHALWLISGLMILATIASFGLNILSSYQHVKVSADVLFSIRVGVYQHLQQLSPRFWTRYKVGDVVSRINNDISDVQRLTADSLLGGLSNVIFLIGSAVIMGSLNYRLLLLSLTVLPLSIWALSFYQKRMTDRVRDMREKSAALGSFLLETLLGVRTVNAYAAERREISRFSKENQTFVDAMLRMQATSFLANAIPSALLTLCTAGIFLYGGKLVIDGQITTGSLVALMAYHARLLAPVQSLMGTYTSLMTGAVSLHRVFELLDIPPEVVERPGAASLENARGEIECRSVAFRHGARTVLNDLSIRIPAGTICAILGPSGAGKSTLAELLVRFYDPDAGSILLDGQDLRDLRLADLRRAVVLVDQLPYLFHASVAENIRYGQPDASQAEVEQAARAAAIHDRIMELPDGYQTLIAERGQTLSVGERQRIALARALLSNPAVLVLDEPTSALDAHNERAIAENLRSALAGRTAIIITHRPMLTHIADQVIDLGAGAQLRLRPAFADARSI